MNLYLLEIIQSILSNIYYSSEFSIVSISISISTRNLLYNISISTMFPSFSIVFLPVAAGGPVFPEQGKKQVSLFEADENQTRLQSRHLEDRGLRPPFDIVQLPNRKVVYPLVN